MIKIWFEQAVQYPDKNSTDLWLLLLQIDIADVGNDFSTWSVFCESANVPDVRVTNDDLVLCVNDPRHASFGHRLLLPANVHGTLLVYRFLHAVIFTFFWHVTWAICTKCRYFSLFRLALNVLKGALHTGGQTILRKPKELSGGKREDYQNCSVLYCVLKLCTVISTLTWAVLTVLWIGFCHTGPISLCIDLFVFVCLLCVFVSYCIVVVFLWAQWGGPDGIEV